MWKKLLWPHQMQINPSMRGGKLTAYHPEHMMWDSGSTMVLWRYRETVLEGEEDLRLGQRSFSFQQDDDLKENQPEL